ncbi:hypothetical protein IWX90DRAFT_107988 [Phyllosticta citrichinensis]|uniref:Uncharacterized protein n=1 Tax=Phyllosticta citrichinensis TaxID=1130410 RepID=A0ABR1Y2U2_9PEZI
MGAPPAQTVLVPLHLAANAANANAFTLMVLSSRPLHDRHPSFAYLAHASATRSRPISRRCSSCCLLDAVYWESTIRLFRKVLAPKAAPSFPARLPAAPPFVNWLLRLARDRPARLLPRLAHPPSTAVGRSARRHCTSCHWPPRRKSTWLSCAALL